MPMRWRWPPLNSCGYRRACDGSRPTSASSACNPFAARDRTRRQSVNVERLADDVLDGHARVERAVRILKDHLNLLRRRAQFRAARRAMSSPSKRTGGGGMDQPDIARPRVRFAATLSPTRPTVSPAQSQS